MHRIKKLFIPNAYDCFYLLLGLIFIQAFLIPNLALGMGYFIDWESFLIVVYFGIVLTAVIVGLSAALSDAESNHFRISKRRFAIAAIVTILSPLLSFFVSEIIQANPAYQYFRNGSTMFYQFDRFQLRFPLLLGICGPMALFVIGLLSFLSFRTLTTAKSGIYGLFRRFQFNRAKALIAIAGLLFTFVFVSNILNAANIDFSGRLNIYAAYIGGGIVILVIALMMLRIPSSWLLNRGCKVKKFSAVILLFAPFVGFVVFCFYRFGLDIQSFFSSACLAIPLAFILGLFCSLSGQYEVDNSNPNSTASKILHEPKRDLRMPAIGTLVLLIGLCGIAVFPFLFNIPILIFEQDWELARQAERIYRQSNGTLQRLPGSDGISINLDQETSADVLKLLDGRTPTYLTLSGENHEVDFDLLPAKLPYGELSINECTLTGAQLNALLKRPFETLAVTQLKVIDSDGAARPKGIETLELRFSYGDQCQILNHIEAFNQIGQIQFTFGNLTPTQCELLAVASKQCPVHVRYDVEKYELSLVPLKKATSRLVLANYFLRGVTQDRVEFLRDSELKFQVYCRNTDDFRKLLTLIFVYPDRFIVSFPQSKFGETSSELLSEFFIFDRDEANQPTGLFYPGGADEIPLPQFLALKDLSFDESWVQSGTKNGEFAFNIDVSRLQNLERLWLSRNSVATDLSILVPLKKLRFLQCTIPESSGVGFDRLLNLENLVLYGVPENSILRNLALLKKLKSVTIVDSELQFSDSDFQTPIAVRAPTVANQESRSEFLAKANRILPGVSVKVVSDKNYAPETPQKFQEHVNRLRIQLLDEISDWGPEEN